MSQPYDPFARGPHPVGVRTLIVRDARRGGRELNVEVWHPASEAYAGADLAEATQDRFMIYPGLPTEAQRAVRDAEPTAGRFPLVLFFHGAFGHRRGSSVLCTHLASHGYLVAAPDFAGHTLEDQMHDLNRGEEEAARVRTTEQTVVDRPRDAQAVMDHLLDGRETELAGLADPERIGTCGVSLGGWTCLALNSLDPRPTAMAPIVPAWGRGPVGAEEISRLVRLDGWGRPVATLTLAAERDAMVMLESLQQLHEELRPPKQFAVLRNAGHMHFSDNAEQRHENVRSMLRKGMFPGAAAFDLAALAEACRPFSELCPAAHGEETVCGLVLAHMDRWLKQSPAAAVFLSRDVADAFARRGIGLALH